MLIQYFLKKCISMNVHATIHQPGRALTTASIRFEHRHNLGIC